MPDTSPVLSLPLIQPAQAQKHVTHNEALRVLDAVVQLVVISADLQTPPEDPQEGARYIVGTPGSGDWAGRDGEIAVRQDGNWFFVPPQAGWRAGVLDPAGEVIFDPDTGWNAAARMPETTPRLGINATADATNRLSLSAPATLLNHDGAGHQLKLNKATPGDTASLLYQTGFSGRAEMGLAGNDAFSIKVSADGAAFVEAMRAEPAGLALPLPLGGAGVFGTAARSGGTSTGALMEEGSNANGAYFRFANGVQMCTGLATLTYDVGPRVRGIWTFPKPFTEGVPTCSGIVDAGSVTVGATPPAQDIGCLQEGPISGTSIEFFLYRVTGAADFAPGDSVTVRVSAMGLWS